MHDADGMANSVLQKHMCKLCFTSMTKFCSDDRCGYILYCLSVKYFIGKDSGVD